VDHHGTRKIFYRYYSIDELPYNREALDMRLSLDKTQLIVTNKSVQGTKKLLTILIDLDSMKKVNEFIVKRIDA
jgi:hypothetical protein